MFNKWKRTKENNELSKEENKQTIEKDPLFISLKEDIIRIHDLESKKEANTFLMEFIQSLLDKEDYCIDIKNKYERQEKIGNRRMF